MLRSRFVWMFPVGLMLLGPSTAYVQTTSTGSGQAYPNKPIRIFVNEPGGSPDFGARLIAPGISGPLGQPVIVGVSVVAAEIVAKAPPDGYALLLFGPSLWTMPLMQITPYDPVKDFSPISMITSSPNVLVVHPSVPAKSVKELIALAKARPRELNYASGPVGASNHIAAELFKVMAGVNIVRVPYKGGGAAIIGVLGGEVELIFSTATAVAPYLKSGKLNALAVTSPQPSALVPGLPTVAASGLPGYEFGSSQGIFAPAKTPAALINRLNQEIVRVLNMTDVRKKFFDTGVEAVGSSPEEFAAKIKSEIATLGKLIKDAGIHVE